MHFHLIASVSHSGPSSSLQRVMTVGLLLGLGWLAPSVTAAQQPLSEFLDSADVHSTDIREARETARGSGSAVDEARGRLLPTGTATGTYTRNEFAIQVQLDPTDPTAVRVISPLDQFDARLALSMPLLDLGAWESFFAAEATADASRERSAAARDSVRMTIVQLWHQVVASRAMVTAAEAALAANESAREAAAARVEVGVSPAAELARAEAESARARQSLAEARLNALVAAQNLEVTTGLRPSDVAVVLTDDLHAEAPLDSFASGAEGLPALRAAEADRRAGERMLEGAWFALLPTINVTLAERFTNAAGFSASSFWTLAFGATWTLDFVRPFAIETREASLAAARIREEETLLLSRAAIVEAWHRVASMIERASAAQASLDANTRAAEDARARFDAGAGTQLESILSERDRFSAEVNHIQAVGDLLVARAALRIRSGMDLE
jgi:outer membrane protein